MSGRRRWFLIGCLGLTTAAPLSAHEIKVLASRLVAELGGKNTVYLSWGHILPVDGTIPSEAIENYVLRTPSGSVKYLKAEGDSLHPNEVRLDESGLYTAMITRKSSLFTIATDEHGNHRHLSGGKKDLEVGETAELASRSHQFGKAVLISEERVSASSNASEPVGHALELIPLDEAGEWRAGRPIRFQVLFEGKPLPRVDVLARYIGFKPDQAWCYAAPTDQDGQMVVVAERPGTWILRVSRSLPASIDDRDDFDVETYTATLALEIRP